MALTREQMKALIDELPDEQINELSGSFVETVKSGPEPSDDDGGVWKEIKFEFPDQDGTPQDKW
ncbi:hypothetical protein HS962_00755 [Pantoea sp. BIGb0393]|uniref:Uncharacterized protein n=1 Tax=Pantoea nemavictus TaxID=2726955 RepID=A0ABU8PNT3_9GAMM|nr:hypothetical protein [Pantoea nemavictus]MBA0034772.1 hypothetical protein [Pantoea nemavictus]